MVFGVNVLVVRRKADRCVSCYCEELKHKIGKTSTVDVRGRFFKIHNFP